MPPQNNLRTRARNLLARLDLLVRVTRLLVRILARKPGQQKVLVVLTEHLGDIVACEPVGRYARTTHPGANIIWVVNRRYQNLVDGNPSIDQVVAVQFLSEWILARMFLLRCPGVKIIDLHLHQRYCGRFGHHLHNPNPTGISLENYYKFGPLLTAFSLAAGLPPLAERPILHLARKRPALELPKRFVVLQSQSNEAERQWDPLKWRAVIDHLGAAYQLPTVEVGLRSTLSDPGPWHLDLCGRLSLEEIAYVIDHAVLFLGIDSAFAHFANASARPSVVLLGRYRKFERYLPYCGPLADPTCAAVLHHDGPVGEMPLKPVLASLGRLLPPNPGAPASAGSRPAASRSNLRVPIASPYDRT
jgi:heptosyltransferase-3